MKKDKELVREISFSLLAEGKTVKIKANGCSMYPLIRPGDILYIEPYGNDEAPVPGEIIAWKRDSGFVVHRLIRITSENDVISFITRGDSCSREDNPVTREQIAGRVIRTENSTAERIRSGERLIRKPGYLYNRFLLWHVIRFRKVLNLINR